MSYCLPESYASYVADPAVRTAVDHILTSKLLEVPEGLDWSQLPDFHAAVLAAHQIRCEYATAVQRLWDAVWQTAIDEAGIGENLEALSIAKTAELYAGVDAVSLFRDGAFTRGYVRGDSRIYLGVSLDLREAWLIFWVGNANYDDLTADLLSQNDWSPEPDEWGYWSKKDLARIEGSCVPLKRLKAAAAGALAAIIG